VLKDSGARRKFDTGAVRDIAEGKGRCDLLPLDVVSNIVDSMVLNHINDYVRCGDVLSLYDAIIDFVGQEMNWDIYTVMIEVSKHYEAGAKKYDERNWEKGIPVHCFIDSGVRHYLKWRRGDTDEPHDRAFLFNILGAIWTHINLPDLIDLPFRKDENNEKMGDI
jgi:hypothetical protein